MGTLTDDIATARDLDAALKTAVRSVADVTIGTCLTTLNEHLQPALDTPSTVDQSVADAIGAAILNLESHASGHTDIMNAAVALHAHLSQAMVDHFPDLDWNEAANVDPQASGGKRKPDPS